ncbi:MAG: hypothetical protein KF773_02760 [Deltaproteobacteria bacterium]|nr:hypothetical protein [Deltaproteobacteria bacterium]
MAHAKRGDTKAAENARKRAEWRQKEADRQERSRANAARRGKIEDPQLQHVVVSAAGGIPPAG